jgi:hypothetical protein
MQTLIIHCLDCGSTTAIGQQQNATKLRSSDAVKACAHNPGCGISADRCELTCIAKDPNTVEYTIVSVPTES